jgi:DNA polymerase-3 subunit chi
VTEIAFHFNAPDRVAYVCRLLRKALNSGAKLVVTGQTDTLRQLDVALWTLSPTDFVPHCLLESEPYVVAASSVILAPSTESVPHKQVLVNLGPSVPNGFEHFDRLIEVVGLDDEDRQLARDRWKHYAERGYVITRHDLAIKGAH